MVSLLAGIDATAPAAAPKTAGEALDLLRDAATKLTPFLMNAVGALVVLVIGLWLAGRARHLIVAALSRSGRIDATLRSFLSSLAYYAMVALVVITTLGVFGVPTTSFAAIIGAAGLAIGLALQGTLGNVASGVMMLGFRPFNVGDFVETGGFTGSVHSISLFTTELTTVDNRKVIIPNGQVANNPIINYNAHDTRRVDLVFGVSYSADLDRAMASIRAVVDAEPRINKTPEPFIVVGELADWSVNIFCRVWVATPDFFPVKFALTKAVKERLDQDGIGIPFPTRTVIADRPA